MPLVNSRPCSNRKLSAGLRTSRPGLAASPYSSQYYLRRQRTWCQAWSPTCILCCAYSRRQLAWLEYDIQFRMELAASVDRSWTAGDPWQYVSCLPVPLQSPDSFEVAELEVPAGRKSKGKRPAKQEADKSSRQPLKKVRKGVCRLHNTAPNGCPYGKECIFLHRCSGCGVVDEHGFTTCPQPGQARPGVRAAQNSQTP